MCSVAETALGAESGNVFCRNRDKALGGPGNPRPTSQAGRPFLRLQKPPLSSIIPLIDPDRVNGQSAALEVFPRRHRRSDSALNALRDDACVDRTSRRSLYVMLQAQKRCFAPSIRSCFFSLGPAGRGSLFRFYAALGLERVRES